MLNLESYQLFLFDFDGLLVDTEKLHYQAYRRTCERWGLTLSWSFEDYAKISLFSSEGIKNKLHKEFPLLHNWSQFYQEKAVCYFELLKEARVKMMPGAQELLKRLKAMNRTICVVTHSKAEYTEEVCRQIPTLELVDHWITREDYQEPKPSPKCYQIAIERYGKGQPVVGFEDSPKGLKALLGSELDPVFVNSLQAPTLTEDEKKRVICLSSLTEI